jgi:hypothetical protein
VEASALQAAHEHLSRDACITYVVNRGGTQISIESASRQFVAVPSTLADSGASMSCYDTDELLGLGHTVKSLPNVELRVVGQKSVNFDGVVSTRVVYKPGTRHELVAPIHILAVKNLNNLAPMLLGRVEQHRMGAVIDTMRQQLLYMPKLHLGRQSQASIPLLCHKATPLQQELQQLARDATAAVAASLPLPRGIQTVALLVPQVRPTLLAAYHDDLLLWDPARGYVAVNLCGADRRVRTAAGVVMYVAGEERRQQRQPAAPMRLTPEDIERFNIAIELLLLSGDIEPNPGPSVLFTEGGVPFGAVVIVVFRFVLNVQYALSVVLACWHTAAAVIAMLLARSGDVEPNPGPPVRDATSEQKLHQWQQFQEQVAGTFRSRAQ